MPAVPQFWSSGQAAAQAITGATEVVVATCNGVTMRYPGQTVTLHGYVLTTTGTTTTAVVLRIRRTNLTGTLVGDQTGQTIAASAGSTEAFERWAIDTPTEIDNATYVLTVVDTGGGTGGTTVYGYLEARVD